MIPSDFIEQLLARVDIVDVVDRCVPLKKAGQNYLACCPFHKEKSPSFTVSPTKQFYHCFGCGAHGSAIGFVMEYQGVGFVDAVKLLADGVGMVVPQVQETPERIQARHVKQEKQASLTDVMSLAVRFYKQQLKQNTAAIEYLKARGLSGEIAARFGLGFAPDVKTGLDKVFQPYEDNKLVEAGLVILSDDGRRYDRFRGRVMFPIRNGRGQFIAFGGRVIGKGEPKYLNSPETPLFEKGRELYGLYEARQAIRQHNCIFVVEGYMDVVALAQQGIENVVATLGTSTTDEHVRILLRHADKIVFCFDGDKAGKKAAWRALEHSLPQVIDGKTIHFLFLPEEHDPDSYVRAFGAQAFNAAVDQQGLSLSAYFLQSLSAEVDLSQAEGRATLVKNASSLLAMVKAPALGFLLRKNLADLVQVTVDELDLMMDLPKKPINGRRQYRLPKFSAHATVTSTVRRLIKWLLMNPSWAHKIEVRDSVPLSGEVACLAALIERAQTFSQAPTAAVLVEGFRGSPHQDLIDAVLNETLKDASEWADPDESDLEMFCTGFARLMNDFDDNLYRELSAKGLSHLSDEEKRLLQILMRRIAARTVQDQAD